MTDWQLAGGSLGAAALGLALYSWLGPGAYTAAMLGVLVAIVAVGVWVSRKRF